MMTTDKCREDIEKHEVTLEDTMIVLADVLGAYCPVKPMERSMVFGGFGTRELRRSRNRDEKTLLKERAALVHIRETFEYYRTDVAAPGKLKSWVRLIDEVIAKVDKVMGTEPRACR